eukprot:12431460-Karenia_brevis.AAC.2
MTHKRALRSKHSHTCRNAHKSVRKLPERHPKRVRDPWLARLVELAGLAGLVELQCLPSQ